jgi:hypothetical protein
MRDLTVGIGESFRNHFYLCRSSFSAQCPLSNRSLSHLRAEFACHIDCHYTGLGLFIASLHLSTSLDCSIQTNVLPDLRENPFLAHGLLGLWSRLVILPSIALFPSSHSGASYAATVVSLAAHRSGCWSSLVERSCDTLAI